MTTKRPPNASYYTDRHGAVRWRFRKKNCPESQTTAVFGSSEWWTWYEHAKAAKLPPIGSSRTKPGSMDDLAVAYYASADWAALKPTTRRTYKGIIDRFRDAQPKGKRWGDLPAKDIDARFVRRAMDAMSDRSAAANNMLKVLRALFRFAVDRDWRSDNPVQFVRAIKRRSPGFTTWTEEDIQAYERRWPVGSKERLAFDLLLFTAQRSGDVRKMGRQHLRNGYISVVQEKTGEALEVPVHPNLQRSLAATPLGDLTFVVTRDGVPYSAKGFSQWMSECADRAGLQKDRSAHGLRKAAARRLAEAGCSAHMIMAVTGHRSLKEVERYCQAAGQRALATTAMKRIGSTN